MVGAAHEALSSRPQPRPPPGSPPDPHGPCRYLDSDALGPLLEAIRNAGYTPIGPTLRDGAIVYAELESVSDLPRGWTDRQDGGTYRLELRNDSAFFGYAVGPHSWKRFLFPPALRLWSAQRSGNAVQFLAAEEPAPRYGFIGVRSCELQAIAIQDRVFAEGPFADPAYRARREAALVVAVHCGNPGGTCFCASLETGPAVRGGFDLALTEVIEDGRHYFTVDVGSPKGDEVLAQVPHRAAEGAEQEAARRVVDAAAGNMGRRLETAGLKQLLAGSYEHPRWPQIAERCLACGNCTMVCPTCFCTGVEDVTSLAGDCAERWRRWDSCFTADFSYIHGGEVRRSVASRYRQWLMHKFATWMDQFGILGCVGCGRCAPAHQRDHAGEERESTMSGLEELLAKHPFFDKLSPEDVELVAGCAANARFAAEEYLAHEGDPADYFYIIREGQVGLEVQGPGRGPLTLLTSGAGDLVGFSWLMPPHRWVFDIRALSVVRALMFDGECLRRKCEQDPRLGYELMKRVAHHMTRQLNTVLMRLPDVYGEPAAQ